MFEGVTSRVDRAKDYLVFQNQIAHHKIGIDFNGAFSSRHPGENKDAVGAEILHDFEGQARGPGRFLD